MDLEAMKARLAQLEAENRALREFVKYTPGAHALFDDTMCYIAATDEWINGYGIVGQDILGRSHYEIFPEIPQRWRDIHSYVLKGAVERNDLDSFVREDGSVTYNKWECRPWYTETGEVGGLLSYTEVITDEVLASQQRLMAEERYSAIIMALPDILFILDRDGKYIYVKPAEGLIAPPEELTGRNISEFLSPDLNKLTISRIQQALNTKEIQAYEYDIDVPQMGKIYFEARVFAVSDDEVIFIARDITSQKMAQQERLQMQQNIIEAQKATLQELSTPIIPIVDGIIVMPLVGTVDTARARDITRSLLAGITQYRARTVILDITGVNVVDSGVADHLNKTIEAARLKGAHTILTGISDAIAETVVDLGINWVDLETLRDLQTGLVAALRREGIGLKRNEML